MKSRKGKGKGKGKKGKGKGKGKAKPRKPQKFRALRRLLPGRIRYGRESIGNTTTKKEEPMEAKDTHDTSLPRFKAWCKSLAADAEGCICS